MGFRDDFVWASAAASYQIEGAWQEDGKGLSVWDVFSHTKGKIFHEDNGDTACDHYHRYPEDVKLMKDIGIHAYRLSISWPRVLPSGIGQVNQAGIDFYSKLIDELLEAGITPFITLFHWDYPYELYKQGGWLNRASSEWFAQYTKVVVDALSDRVQNWFTHNEPQVFMGLGHQEGLHAPGLTLPPALMALGNHHVLMAHGRAVQTIREYSKLTPNVGWAPVTQVCWPASDKPEDIEAARKATFTDEPFGMKTNTWFSDPAVLGHYPEETLRQLGEDAPRVEPGDMGLICQPLDFFGTNIYNGTPYEAGPDGEPRPVEWPVGHPHTMFHWPIDPDAIYWGPKFLAERYNLPLYITENGLSCHDWVDLDGNVEDPQRIDFTRRYLRRLRDAADDGVDLRGYFHWSIMDNFEWADGYRQRFGMIHVDFNTFKRTPKASSKWYSEVIKTNGENI